MRILKPQKNGRLFNQFLISYLLVFILPITMIFSIMYLWNADVLRREITQAQNNTLFQARRALDFEAQRYRTVATVLANQNEIIKLSRIKREDLTTSDVLSMQRMRLLIQTLSAGTEGTEHMFLYLAENGYVLESQRALPIEDIYIDLKGAQTKPANVDAWKRILAPKYSGQWLSIEGNLGNQLCFAQTLPANNGPYAATFMVRMRASHVDQILGPIRDDSSWTGMINMQGDILYQSTAAPVELNMDWFDQEEGQRNQDGWIISYTRSNVTNDVFLSIVSASAILSPLRNALFMSILILCAAFIVLTILAYYTTVRNFQPFKQLVAIAASGRDVPTGDEYTQLRVALLEAADEKNELRRRLDRDRRQTQDHQLYQRLIATPDWGALKQVLASSGAPAQRTAYLLVRVEIVDYTGEESPLEQMCDVRDIFDAHGRGACPTLSIQLGPALLLLFHLQTGSLVEIQDLRRGLMEDVQFVRENYAIDLQLYISEPHGEDGGLGDAILTMEMETRRPDSRITDGERGIQADRAAAGLSYEVVEAASKQFVLACKGADQETVNRALGKLSGELLALAARATADVHNPETAEYQIKQQVMQIVEAHFADPMLSVSSIADHLGMSADHVSKVFKQTTLIGLLDYIHHIRVKRAKLILTGERNITIAQVGQRVGYVNTDSFIRAFKRIEGTTPGKYRDHTP